MNNNHRRPILPESSLLREQAEDWKARAAALLKAAKALDNGTSAALEKAAVDLRRLERPCLDEHAKVFESHLAHELASRKDRLRHGLREGCAGRGFAALVRSPDPLVLFIDPFTVHVDIDRNQAELRFAELKVGAVEAEAAAILKARAHHVEALNGRDWSAEAYLRLLNRAWRRTEKTAGAEIGDVLFEVACLKQSPMFRKRPTKKLYQDYTKLQFAWDLTRLRRERLLQVDGVRLSIQPATGGSTRNKSGLIWLENGPGRGHWCQTLRFVEATPPPTPLDLSLELPHV